MTRRRASSSVGIPASTFKVLIMDDTDRTVCFERDLQEPQPELSVSGLLSASRYSSSSAGEPNRTSSLPRTNLGRSFTNSPSRLMPDFLATTAQAAVFRAVTTEPLLDATESLRTETQKASTASQPESLPAVISIQMIGKCRLEAMRIREVSWTSDPMKLAAVSGFNPHVKGLARRGELDRAVAMEPADDFFFLQWLSFIVDSKNFLIREQLEQIFPVTRGEPS